MPGLRSSLLAGALAIATFAGAAGIAADAAGANAAQAVSIGYTCAFPAGSYRVGVSIAASVASAGGRFGPVRLRVTTTLPRAGLGLAARPGQASPVKLAGLLTVTRTSRSAKPVTLTWPVSADGSVPASGDPQLTASGTVPATAAARPGLVTFSAGELRLVLFIGNGAPIRARCRPDGGGAEIATATVPAVAGSAKVKFPPGCGDIKVVGNGAATCAYVTGYSDVAKLIGAALLQPRGRAKPGLANVDFAERSSFKPGKLIEHSTGELLYRGRHELPPVTATFLAFRFVPVTATLHLIELTSIVIISSSGVTAPPYPITVTTQTKVSVRVTNVRVNGVPLDVGSGCRTAAPLRLILIGRGDNTLPPKGYTVPTGGALAGKVTIPPFIDCGVGENLDPLLTGSISGRGNFVKITQGKLCGTAQPQNWVCPPPVPKPQR